MSNYIKFFKGEFEKHAVPYTPRQSRQTAPPVAAPPATPAKPAAPVAPGTAPQRASKLPKPGSKGVIGPVVTAPKPTAHPAQSASHSVPAVKEMQTAILNLANIASSSDVTAMHGNQEGKQQGPQTRAIPGEMPHERHLGNQQSTVDDKEFLGGNDPFGNFIVQNYIPKDSVAGRQFLNVDVAGGKNRMDASIKPANLRGIIDTIKRVGTPGSVGTEKSVDGIWQTRTNNSLHLIADLVSAMINLTKDMRIPVAGFTDEQLKAFREKIPATYTEMKSPDDIAQRAKALTPDLNAISVFFTNLKPAVLDNQEVRKFVDQKEPFAKYVNSKFPGEMALFRLPGIKLGLTADPVKDQISLNDLSTIDKFKEFIQRQGLIANDQEQVKKILNMVAEKLNSKIDLGF